MDEAFSKAFPYGSKLLQCSKIRERCRGVSVDPPSAIELAKTTSRPATRCAHNNFQGRRQVRERRSLYVELNLYNMRACHCNIYSFYGRNLGNIDRDN